MSGNEIITANEKSIISQTITDILTPILSTMADMVKRNTEALERLAAQQKVQSDRMEALERQIRLNTLVTPTQAKFLNDAMRQKARDILSRWTYEGDKKAVNALAGKIRRSVCSRYGIASVNEIPKHEYSVAMEHIAVWNDLLIVRDVCNAARERRQE